AIVADMLRPDATWENLCLSATPDGVEVVGFKVDSLKRYEGQRLSQIARAMGKTWPDAIIDLTPAEHYRLGHLVFIACDSTAGMYADVVLFDPATIIDRASYEQPNQLSVGVRELLVNGVAVLRDGVHTGAKPGRVVLGPGGPGPWR